MNSTEFSIFIRWNIVRSPSKRVKAWPSRRGLTCRGETPIPLWYYIIDINPIITANPNEVAIRPSPVSKVFYLIKKSLFQKKLFKNRNKHNSKVMCINFFLLIISIQLATGTPQANFAEALDRMIKEQNPKTQVSDSDLTALVL